MLLFAEQYIFSGDHKQSKVLTENNRELLVHIMGIIGSCLAVPHFNK